MICWGAPMAPGAGARTRTIFCPCPTVRKIPGVAPATGEAIRMIVGVWVLVGETKGEGVVGSCTGVWGNWGIAGVAGVVVGVPEKKT